MMRLYGRTNLAEFLGDLVVYRNLEPADARLPGLAAGWREMGLEGPRVPRKAEQSYAQAIVHLLRRAQALLAPATPLERLLYVGDTRLLDGTAYRNILQVSGWPGLAFIASEKRAEPARMEREGSLLAANRWALLGDFMTLAEAEGIAVGPGSAVVLDLDKTTFGARGRNDGAVDRARVDGVRATVAALLGSGGQLPDEAPDGVRLGEEIVITQEVREGALAAGRRGALVFGLSDKPDEAATPTEEGRRQGREPLHRISTHSYGESLAAPWGPV